ncbi:MULTISPECIES: hypothetical protein [Pseudomonas]|uniref:hypothetical protein n=1 Tax=Pseudomonas TaxID=286 RepID=UPI0012F8DECC|nr:MULTISPECIES: hypothetical protein [Pseudomonas]MDC7828735.1 hypothetical protein [Pseudomonas benzopyrenica]
MILKGGSGAIEGADTIGAGAGVYTLTGGKGSDTCVFTPTSDSALDALDTITLAKASDRGTAHAANDTLIRLASTPLAEGTEIVGLGIAVA